MAKMLMKSLENELKNVFVICILYILCFKFYIIVKHWNCHNEFEVFLQCNSFI